MQSDITCPKCRRTFLNHEGPPHGHYLSCPLCQDQYFRAVCPLCGLGDVYNGHRCMVPLKCTCGIRFFESSCPQCGNITPVVGTRGQATVSCGHCQLQYCEPSCPKCGLLFKQEGSHTQNGMVCPQCSHKFFQAECPECHVISYYGGERHNTDACSPATEMTCGCGQRFYDASCPQCRKSHTYKQSSSSSGKRSNKLHVTRCRDCDVLFFETVCPHCHRAQPFTQADTTCSHLACRYPPCQGKFFITHCLSCTKSLMFKGSRDGSWLKCSCKLVFSEMLCPHCNTVCCISDAGQSDFKISCHSCKKTFSQARDQLKTRKQDAGADDEPTSPTVVEQLLRGPQAQSVLPDAQPPVADPASFSEGPGNVQSVQLPHAPVISLSGPQGATVPAVQLGPTDHLPTLDGGGTQGSNALNAQQLMSTSSLASSHLEQHRPQLRQVVHEPHGPVNAHHLAAHDQPTSQPPQPSPTGPAHRNSQFPAPCVKMPMYHPESVHDPQVLSNCTSSVSAPVVAGPPAVPYALSGPSLGNFPAPAPVPPSMPPGPNAPSQHTGASSLFMEATCTSANQGPAQPPPQAPPMTSNHRPQLQTPQSLDSPHHNRTPFMATPPTAPPVSPPVTPPVSTPRTLPITIQLHHNEELAQSSASDPVPPPHPQPAPSPAARAIRNPNPQSHAPSALEHPLFQDYQGSIRQAPPPVPSSHCEGKPTSHALNPGESTPSCIPNVMPGVSIEVVILLLGCSGAGKSSLGNILAFQDNAFVTGISTTSAAYVSTQMGSTSFTVIDTPPAEKAGDGVQYHAIVERLVNTNHVTNLLFVSPLHCPLSSAEVSALALFANEGGSLLKQTLFAFTHAFDAEVGDDIVMRAQAKLEAIAAVVATHHSQNSIMTDDGLWKWRWVVCECYPQWGPGHASNVAGSVSHPFPFLIPTLFKILEVATRQHVHQAFEETSGNEPRNLFTGACIEDRVDACKPGFTAADKVKEILVKEFRENRLQGELNRRQVEGSLRGRGLAAADLLHYNEKGSGGEGESSEEQDGRAQRRISGGRIRSSSAGRAADVVDESYKQAFWQARIEAIENRRRIEQGMFGKSSILS